MHGGVTDAACSICSLIYGSIGLAMAAACMFGFCGGVGTFGSINRNRILCREDEVYD